MPLVEHNDVIEAFPANRPDDAFGEGILPGRSRGDEDLAHPEAFHPPDEDIAVDRVPVAEQVLGRGLFGKALDKLVGGPGGRGLVGGVDMDEFSPVVSKDQESEEQLEGEGGHDENVDSDNLADVCLQEIGPMFQHETLVSSSCQASAGWAPARKIFAWGLTVMKLLLLYET